VTQEVVDGPRVLVAEFPSGHVPSGADETNHVTVDDEVTLSKLEGDFGPEFRDDSRFENVAPLDERRRNRF
jgi:hypothetical protein